MQRYKTEMVVNVWLGWICLFSHDTIPVRLFTILTHSWFGNTVQTPNDYYMHATIDTGQYTIITFVSNVKQLLFKKTTIQKAHKILCKNQWLHWYQLHLTENCLISEILSVKASLHHLIQHKHMFHRIWKSLEKFKTNDRLSIIDSITIYWPIIPKQI